MPPIQVGPKALALVEGKLRLMVMALHEDVSPHEGVTVDKTSHPFGSNQG